MVVYVLFDLINVPGWNTNYISLKYHYSCKFHPNIFALSLLGELGVSNYLVVITIVCSCLVKVYFSLS